MVSKARNPESQMLFNFMYLGIQLFLSDFKPKHWLFFHGNEFWKDIKGYEGLYQVSSLGNVKSLNRVVYRGKIPINLKGKYLSFNRVGNTYKTNPYHAVRFKKGNTILVHTLVAEAFIPNLNSKNQINHKDLNKNNNNFKNLEWTTQLENINHYKALGIGSIRNNKILVLDTQTGVYYNSIFEASVAKNLNYNSLMAWLGNYFSGRNKTNLIRV